MERPRSFSPLLNLPSGTSGPAPRAEGHSRPGQTSPDHFRSSVLYRAAVLYSSPVAARPAPEPTAPSADEALARFSPAIRDWFAASFASPTPAQVGGWAAISSGRHALIHAPTGSGKTLAAFLWCLDRLVREPSPAPTHGQPGTVRILYVSPLKALSYDVERNLRAPLAGIARAAALRGDPAPSISVGLRTGDSSAEERRAIARRPPDILITTPESLYLLLTSAARESLRGVEHVIVDEVHAIAGTKRGAHLALSLERLEGSPPGRPSGSACRRPSARSSSIARFLGGAGPGRDVTVVDAGSRKLLELTVVVPVEDMSRLGEAVPLEERPAGPGGRSDLRVSIWPSIHPQDPRADPGPPEHDRLLQQPAPGRTPGAAPERAGRRGARPGPPRIDRPRAAPVDRGRPEVGSAAGDRGDLEPRARDRHGRRRSRDPGRVADIGRPRSPADRPGRPPGGRTLARRDLPQVPGRPPRGRGRGRADARRGDRDDRRSRATRSTWSPSRSWR